MTLEIHVYTCISFHSYSKEATYFMFGLIGLTFRQPISNNKTSLSEMRLSTPIYALLNLKYSLSVRSYPYFLSSYA